LNPSEREILFRTYFLNYFGSFESV
jgi:hypothetical protein